TAPRRALRAWGAATSRAKPARPTSSSMHGSPATSRSSSASSGWASASLWASARTRPAASWHCRSGSATLTRCCRYSPIGSAATARIAPRGTVPAEVKTPGARGDPDLPGGHVAVHDDLRAVVEFELEHAAFLELEIRVDPAFVERALDPLQGLRRQSVELALI